jgi:Right handed beta helix region
VPLLAALALAAALRDWWPLELAGLMLGVGLALDAELYHRVLPYQAGWLALPMGALELGLLMALVLLLGIDAPLAGALALFAGTWLWTQAVSHAGLPLWRLSWAEDGGEVGRRAAPALTGVVLAVFAGAGGLAWANRLPTVRLDAGVHRGPLVIDRPERLVGERGAIVRGGIVVRSSHVTIEGVTVVGGENGIVVDGVRDVHLKDVSVSGFQLDGIHVRRSSVMIDGCTVSSPAGPWSQAIDVSYTFDLDMSMIQGCTVVGGREGIVTHFSQIDLMDNRVSGTRLRGIDMTEMSMGAISHNEVVGALGVAIFCGDHSMCTIEHNVVTDTRPDRASGDLTRAGFGILAHYGSEAELRDNRLVRSPGGAAAILDSRLVRR